MRASERAACVCIHVCLHVAEREHKPLAVPENCRKAWEKRLPSERGASLPQETHGARTPCFQVCLLWLTVQAWIAVTSLTNYSRTTSNRESVYERIGPLVSAPASAEAGCCLGWCAPAVYVQTKCLAQVKDPSAFKLRTLVHVFNGSVLG